MDIDRTELIRRLLGTATQLFLDEKDPISVHCLAASALEHAEYLAISANAVPLKSHILETFPQSSEKEINRLRNQHYRSIKHSHDLKGVPFDIEKELNKFDDRSNDALLFAGWHDFMLSGAPIPIAAQVFQLWFFRLYPSSLNPNRDFKFPLFDKLQEATRSAQKQRLRRAIAEVYQTFDIVADEKTDIRELVLT